jgi:hypothetical protein
MYHIYNTRVVEYIKNYILWKTLLFCYKIWNLTIILFYYYYYSFIDMIYMDQNNSLIRYTFDNVYLGNHF